MLPNWFPLKPPLYAIDKSYAENAADGPFFTGEIPKRTMPPKEKWIDFPLQLIYHGRALCFARKPRCAACKLDPLCYAKDKFLD